MNSLPIGFGDVVTNSLKTIDSPVSPSDVVRLADIGGAIIPSTPTQVDGIWTDTITPEGSNNPITPIYYTKIGPLW